MRLLTGELKGRGLHAKASPGLRPTSDKVRQAVFDMLRAVLPGASVLDLYAGTGALGLEALSGGARSAVFVEADRARCRLIEKNLKALGLAAKAAVFAQDAGGAVRRLSRNGDRFDLILMDPPYADPSTLGTLEAIALSDLALPGATLVLERAKGAPEIGGAGVFNLVKTRYHGDTRIDVFRAQAR